MARFPEVHRRVVVVGAGLGGTATAVRLLLFAREPLEVVLVERRPEHRSAGVAYHREGNPWQHVFNIQAGRMAMFREDVDDFVVWANTEADRADWPPEWRDAVFTESGPAPRRIYADYLAERLAEAAREASAGVTLTEVDGEATDVDVADDGTRVTVETPTGRTTIRADHVVIATGLEERELPFAAEVADHPSFLRHPYSGRAVERILAQPPDTTVAVIGTLLSAYDVASLLLRRGHTGPIRMISRSGLTLRTYPDDHRHRVLPLPAPKLDRATYEGRDDLVRLVVEEWERATAAVAREHPDVPPAVVTERITKAWEPHLPPALARVPTDDLRALLDRHSSLLATLRVSAVAYTTEVVHAAMGPGGQIDLITGRVDRIAPTGSGTLELTVDPVGTVEADLVIANFGREPDYARTGSTLWRTLLRKGLAVPHARTGRGVEVDASGTLLGPGGTPSGPISAVGGPREGDELVRHGRLGAFAFNLAAIKNHSVGVAAAVLRRVESCYDDRGGAAALADSPDPDVREAFAHAVALEVRRMAARRRRDREVWASWADRGITTLGTGARLPDAVVRHAVNTAATTALNDLSVTPRDLYARLGLGEPVPHSAP
ncbi:FAD/NAD(P)-binding protein [Saccharothrix syringae]|uniref:Pyridine nucleotide-disulfide oxidoreductase n=1 Tax=Saccharothrix syringae TaxID=103733 RepID=A0A5Q0H3X1_SACSY|nr:FAD/NAD(P)-binding protein [Saccharothrix syringae]QFZ20743.1 pyridine nucleotide-disulfide oxidoreductase [Saccharothrix syringae]